MHSTKLIKYLNAIPPVEFKAFHKYVHNHVSAQTIKDLVDYIKQYYPNLQHDKLHIQLVSQRLFPDLEFNDNRMRKVMSKTVGALNDYWVTQAALEDDAYRNKAIREKLLAYDLYQDYQSISEKRSKKLTRESSKSIAEWRELHTINEEWAYNWHQLTKKQFSEVTRESIKYEGIAQCIVNLRYLTAYQYNNTNLGMDIPRPVEVLKEKLNNIVESHGDIPEVQTLVRLYKLLENYNIKAASEVLENIKQNAKYISHLSLYSSLRILVMRAINPQSQAEYAHLKEIIVWGMNSNNLVLNNKPDPTTVTAMVLQLCSNGNADLAEDYILRLTKKFNSDHLKPWQHCNLGTTYFFKKEYDKAITYLTFSDPNQNVIWERRRRVLLIYTYFYLSTAHPSYRDLGIYELNNFKIYLIRNKNVSKSRRLYNLTTISLLRNIISPTKKKTKTQLLISNNTIINDFTKNILLDLLKKI